jgi:hypothetical protein
VPAAGHHLDLFRAIAERFPHRPGHFGRAVRHDQPTLPLHKRQLARDARMWVVVVPEVAVPGSLGDIGPGRKHTRADDLSLLDSTMKPDRGSTDVPHRREAPQQHLTGLNARQGTDVHPVVVVADLAGPADQGEVDVGVHQPGHQRAPAAIDHGGSAPCRRAVPDRLDQVALDQHILGDRQFLAFAIEHIDVLD